MTSKYPISKLERRLLLAFAFLLFAVFATEAFCDAVQSYNRSVYIQQQELARAAGATVINFSGNGPQTTPLFHLVSLFIFLTIWRQRYLQSFLPLTSLSYFSRCIYATTHLILNTYKGPPLRTVANSNESHRLICICIYCIFRNLVRIIARPIRLECKLSDTPVGFS